MKPLCIYHGNCADGFTAAWAVWKRFGDEFDYFPGVYQQPPPDVSGRDVVLVDFSYKHDVLLAMSQTARSILVLDHHKSAAEDLARGGQFFAKTGGDWEGHLLNVQQDRYENSDINGVIIYSLFDMERSGAGLTWDFFHPGKERPRLVCYVEDRDLWRFRLDGSREANAYVFAHAYKFDAWEKLHWEFSNEIDAVKRAGAAIEKKHHKDVAELVAALKVEMNIGGHLVPVANLPYTLTSDAGNLMCQQLMDYGLGGVDLPRFAACYWDTPKGRVFSLRSVGDFDVSAIAAQYGGGGHKNAAGFTLAHGVAP